MSYLKIGVKHVLKFSVYNYILFLVLLVVFFSFKKWRKILLMIIFLGLSYFSGILLVIYGGFIPKLDILKFLIPATIFFLAVFNILSIKKIINTQKYVLFFTILFGFFNGLGTSRDVLFQLERNESELIPILEAALGAGTSLFLMSLGMITIVTLLIKVSKIYKNTLALASSIVIAAFSISMMFIEIFK
jgi:hypothetical protein